MLIVYFSSVSEYTKKFVEKLPYETRRLPLYAADDLLEVDEPFVLISPTYGQAAKKAVPKQVVKFLNNERNASYMQAVVPCGNRNFGADFCIAGDIISNRFGVPILHKVELFGLPGDAEIVIKKIDEMENQLD